MKGVWQDEDATVWCCQQGKGWVLSLDPQFISLYTPVLLSQLCCLGAGGVGGEGVRKAVFAKEEVAVATIWM